MSNETGRKWIDPTIRLDLVLTILLMAGTFVVLGARQEARIDTLEGNQRTTTEILGDLQDQIRENKSMIDYSNGFQEGRRYEWVGDDG